jgi:hypothetical protein
MDSLKEVENTSRAAGFAVTTMKVRRGAPGWHNAGPVLHFFLANKQMTHIFMAADDVIYPNDVILRLVGDDKDVVAGIYRKNYVDRFEFANFDPEPEKILEHYHSRGVHPTTRCSHHSMTIKRAVIEKMVQDYPELQYEQGDQTHYGLFLPMIENKTAIQDDWAFSIRAVKSGFTLWNDWGCRLKHYCCEFLGSEGV